MFGRRKQTSTRIDTLLGKTATLKGDLEFSGGLHLDGRVNGNVRSSAADGGALFGIVLVVCLLASGLGVRTAMKIDPASALAG